MKDITIICCWNDKKQYQRLIDSIKIQDIKVNIIGIDNRNQVYTSCSRALNDAIYQVNTKYVLFSHQDIIFNSPTALNRILAYLNCINESDILGVAGSSFNSIYVKTNVLVGNCDELEYGGTERVNGIEECNTLDECLFGGYTEYFRKTKFDESICYDWHLYAVEICLRTMYNGGKIYVCDVELIHKSKGKLDYSYNEMYRLLCKKYSGSYKYLRTPCCYYSGTSFLKRNIYYLKKLMGLKIRNLRDK